MVGVISLLWLYLIVFGLYFYLFIFLRRWEAYFLLLVLEFCYLSYNFYSFYHEAVYLMFLYIWLFLFFFWVWLIGCAAFGQSSSSSFGSQSVFGQTSSSGNNPFAPKPFGSSNPFGSQTGGSVFGSTSTGVFGQPSTPAFGASSAPAFGSSMPAFGASSTPAFGGSSSSFGGEYIWD